MGLWLHVEEACNPHLIMWQNLGYSKFVRCLRILFTTIIALLLILATMFIVLGQSYVNT